MSKLNIVRAWKDQEYRLTLTAEQLSQIPASPAGAIDLSDTELDYVAGATTEYNFTTGCCVGLTTNTCTCTWGPSCTVTITCSIGACTILTVAVIEN